MTALQPHWADLSRRDAKRAAEFVCANPDALDAYLLGDADYPTNVAREIDRLLAAADRADDGHPAIHLLSKD